MPMQAQQQDGPLTSRGVDRTYCSISVQEMAERTNGWHIADASHGCVIPKATQGRQRFKAALRQSRVFAAGHRLKQCSCCGFRAVWMPACCSSIRVLLTLTPKNSASNMGVHQSQSSSGLCMVIMTNRPFSAQPR